MQHPDDHTEAYIEIETKYTLSRLSRVEWKTQMKCPTNLMNFSTFFNKELDPRTWKGKKYFLKN